MTINFKQINWGVIALVIGCVINVTALAAGYGGVSTAARSALTQVNCSTQHFTLTADKLQFGTAATDSSAHPEKIFYFIKNISDNNLVLDFPNGHLGATAWIPQVIHKGRWLGYVSVPGTGYLPGYTSSALGKNPKVLVQRLFWVCQKLKNGKKVDCAKSLFVCAVPQQQLAHSKTTILQTRLKTALLRAKRSWWTYSTKAVAEGGAASPVDVFALIGVTAAPIYGHCRKCQAPGSELKP